MPITLTVEQEEIQHSMAQDMLFDRATRGVPVPRMNLWWGLPRLPPSLRNYLPTASVAAPLPDKRDNYDCWSEEIFSEL